MNKHDIKEDLEVITGTADGITLIGKFMAREGDKSGEILMQYANDILEAAHNIETAFKEKDK